MNAECLNGSWAERAAKHQPHGLVHDGERSLVRTAIALTFPPSIALSSPPESHRPAPGGDHRHRRSTSAGAQSRSAGRDADHRRQANTLGIFMVERNMCNAVMRGIVVPPGSRATSRAQGSRRNLGYLVSGRHLLTPTVRIGKARSRVLDGTPIIDVKPYAAAPPQPLNGDLMP